MYKATLPQQIVRSKICPIIIMSLTRFPSLGSFTRKLCKVEVVSVYNLLGTKEFGGGEKNITQSYVP